MTSKVWNGLCDDLHKAWVVVKEKWNNFNACSGAFNQFRANVLRQENLNKEGGGRLQPHSLLLQALPDTGCHDPENQRASLAIRSEAPKPACVRINIQLGPLQINPDLFLHLPSCLDMSLPSVFRSLYPKQMVSQDPTFLKQHMNQLPWHPQDRLGLYHNNWSNYGSWHFHPFDCNDSPETELNWT